MKKTKVHFLIFFVLYIFHNNIAQKRVIPSTNLTLSVLVKTNKDSFASGFYYQDSSYTYFVTARHVLFEYSTSALRADTLTLISHSADLNDKTNDILIFPLKLMLKNNLIKFHQKYDIALIRFAKTKMQSETEHTISIYKDILIKQKSKSGFLTISSNDIQPYDSVFVSNDVFIMGYPRAIGVKNFPQIDYNEPLIKRGIIAGKNKKQRTIILDCEIFGGNSGGPVIELVRNYGENTDYYYIIGILSQFVPWANPTLNKKDITISNSSYSVVVPIDNIFELINNWD